MKTPQIIKTSAFVFLASILIAETGCEEKSKVNTTDNFATIESMFADPPAEYRTMPFMVWNSKVTKTDIDRMLLEFKEAGCGGAFVHPRPGMITEYMSDDWHSLFDYAVEKGKELGLEIWIYDENSYPSGFAGGHVPQDMPESYNQGQGLALEKVTMLPDTVKSFAICLMKENDTWKDITSSVDEYKKVKGDYYLYKKTFYGTSDWYGGYSYVDLLVPGVTEKFIEVTMKGYEKSMKQEFGKAVPGIFTDEPNVVTSGGFRWTPDLFDVFQKQWGYDLKQLIPLLSEETGEWRKVRHNYMETLLQLFVDRWSKPWYNYTEANNLKWTGHYWEHGWPQLNDGGDNMAMYAWHQVPAIDMLFNQFDEVSPQAQFGNIRAVKELRSVANQMGYTRTLSETYGGGGWDETLKDLKRLGDWEYVLGVNFMNQHLSHMTLTGARKYDYPPVFTYHSPWWRTYKEQNDYFGRLSMLMSRGVQQNDILVLEPTSTLWTYYAHTGSPDTLMGIGRNFQAFVTLLEKNQVEYDLGSENIIKDQGRVENGQFIVNKAAYTTVVIPPLTENLNKPTFALLKQFVEQGGKVVTFASPQLIDGASNSELSSLLQNASVVKVAEATKESVLKEFTDPTFKIEHNNGNLYHQRRLFRDGELIFLVNSSMDEVTTGTITAIGKTIVEMDAMTGTIHTYPNTKEKDVLTTSFRIEPAGSLLLYASKKGISKYKTKPDETVSKLITADNATKVTRVQDNALNIDFCDITVNSKTLKNLNFSNAADEVFKAYGFKNGNPWNTSVQYKRNILDRDTFNTGGFTATYHFTVNDDFDYSSMKLVSERPEFFTVKVNGQAVNQLPNTWWLDISFGVYEIGKQVKKGKNTVELSVSAMSIFAETEPIYITGNFAVVPEAKGWSISAPVEKLELGSWKEQKQPFYSWDVKYSKTYTIDDTSGAYMVKLGKWSGTVAEVYVNGQKAGNIVSDPYQLNVAPFLKKGTNEIEVNVIGSLKNLLGPHYRNPRPGLASPWHWKGVKEQIPGNEYQMIDYGLMDDFSLLH